MGRTIVFVQDPKDIEIVFKADGKYPMRPNDGTKIDETYKKIRNLPQTIMAL